jgi:hypothetical protein
MTGTTEARRTLAKFVTALRQEYPAISRKRAVTLAIGFVDGEFAQIPGLDQPMGAVWQRMRAEDRA